ncbi:hypothetical protein A5639_24415 [Mycolicibacterium conceptionense]|nr:hypothetical protein A5639_24415 [Mycolicibacterium conceptionense]
MKCFLDDGLKFVEPSLILLRVRDTAPLRMPGRAVHTTRIVVRVDSHKPPRRIPACLNIQYIFDLSEESIAVTDNHPMSDFKTSTQDTASVAGISHRKIYTEITPHSGNQFDVCARQMFHSQIIRTERISGNTFLNDLKY